MMIIPKVQAVEPYHGEEMIHNTKDPQADPTPELHYSTGKGRSHQP